jgi:hypothetical protein
MVRESMGTGTGGRFSGIEKTGEGFVIRQPPI